MLQKRFGAVLVLLALALVLVTAAVAVAADGLTPEEVAAAEREFTYTTAEDVAAGKLAAERYWLYAHTMQEIVAAEREFTYTTAEDVLNGKVSAKLYWQSREPAASQ